MAYNFKGILTTVIFHVLLLLLLIFLGFSTPLPLPAEEGILINFGDAPEGFGELETATEQTNESYSEPQPESSPSSNDEEAFMAQDYEKAPTIKSSEKKTEKKAEKKQSTNKTQTASTQTKDVKTEKTEPKPNPAANYANRLKNRNTGSEGVTSGSGNQGSPTGDPNATNRTLGMGGGGGITANVSGRQLVYVSKPVLKEQKEGIVVVEVQVDRTGKVISAEPGKKGTTTPDAYLHNLAKQAALKTKFDRKDDAPVKQYGYITYHFKLVSR